MHRHKSPRQIGEQSLPMHQFSRKLAQILGASIRHQVQRPDNVWIERWEALKIRRFFLLGHAWDTHGTNLGR